MTWFFDNPY